MDLIRKTLTCTFEKADDSGRILHGVVGSTIDEDRDDDVLDPKGAQLDEFKANPVFLANHDYSVESIIGRVLNPVASEKNITFDVEFDMDDPFSASIAGKFARKFAKAISVGFRGVEATPRTKLGTDHPHYKEDSRGLYFAKWAVREFSAVAIPANPNALAAGYGMKGARDGGLKAVVLDLIAKDDDIRSAVRGLLMGAQFESGSGSEEPGSLPLTSWLAGGRS